MKVITGPRQSGKTTEAIKLANEHDAYLCVHTQDRAQQVYHSDKHPDLDRFPITYGDLRQFRGRPKTIVIDDVMMLLNHFLTDVHIRGVTITSEEATILQGEHR